MNEERLSSHCAKWANRFYEMAQLTATWSRDPSTKVGAVIYTVDNVTVSTGYNGFPRGVDHHPNHYETREEKLLWTVHAEENAIFNAARTGRSTFGCVLVATLFPCVRCARAIVQAGIGVVFAPPGAWADPTDPEPGKRSTEIMEAGGVKIWCLTKTPGLPKTSSEPPITNSPTVSIGSRDSS